MILFLLACLDEDVLPTEGTFVAMQADFAEYESWSAQPVATEDTGHVNGDRIVYLNKPKADDSAAFSTGTILLKTITTEAGVDVHAMVKRGGDYNADGAFGWEWFGLTLATDGTPLIEWRGESPPVGEAYGQLPGGGTDSVVTGDCNSCHSAVSANDFVHTVPL